MSNGIPHVYHNVLPRRGIAEIINSASINAAVYIVAPYGCGKTLAVISWIGKRSVVWIDLCKDDNTIAGFKARVEQAMSREDSENILVIDNFHFIKNAELLRFAKNFIFDCLENWRIIIISRTDLPPAFNDLMLRGHIRMITLKDLSFTADEIAEYFRINGCEISVDDLLRLRDETDGWPAALNVVLTVSRGGPIGYRIAARSYVMTFFETEIWNGLDNSIRDFMLKTSILDKLTPSSCHAVTELGSTLPMIRWLFLNGMFITRMDERESYQYHRVFRDFLMDRLKASDIDEKGLYKKLAWWLYERGEFERAFIYFFEAHDLHGVSRILKIMNMLEMGGIEKFLELYSRIIDLDVSELKPYPIIVARMALIQYLMGNVTEMQELYHTFLEWMESGELMISPEEYAEYIWEAGWLCYLDPSENMLNNTKHEEWCNYSTYVPHLLSLQWGRAKVLRFPSILRGLRDYSESVTTVEEFLENTEIEGKNILLGEEDAVWQAYLMLAEYKYETEDFIKAEEIILRIMALAEERGHIDFYFICTALFVRLLRARNDLSEIGELIGRLEAMIVNNNARYMMPNFHAFQLRQRLADGQPGFTEEFINENSAYEERPYFYLFYRHIALARGHLSLGGFNKTLLILGNLDMLCHKYKRETDLIEINILRSIALFNVENEEAACRSLMDALNSSRQYGYIRIFADDAKGIWPILTLVGKRVADSYIKSVMLSCKKALRLAGNLPSKKYAHLALTKKEMQILKSLQLGMSYEEIAQDNNIRISTVKTHVHSIYSKLDVDNRTSAVLVAQNKGFIIPTRI